MDTYIHAYIHTPPILTYEQVEVDQGDFIVCGHKHTKTNAETPPTHVFCFFSIELSQVSDVPVQVSDIPFSCVFVYIYVCMYTFMFVRLHVCLYDILGSCRSNVEIGAKVSENLVDEISKFKKEVKFIYEEMNRPYYKSNAKNDPCGAKLEQFYHTAYNDMEVCTLPPPRPPHTDTQTSLSSAAYNGKRVSCDVFLVLRCLSCECAVRNCTRFY